MRVLFEGREIRAENGFFVDDLRGEDLYQRYRGERTGYGESPVAVRVYQRPETRVGSSRVDRRERMNRGPGVPRSVTRAASDPISSRPVLGPFDTVFPKGLFRRGSFGVVELAVAVLVELLHRDLTRMLRSQQADSPFRCIHKRLGFSTRQGASSTSPS